MIVKELDREIDRVETMIRSGRDLRFVGRYDDGRYRNNHVEFGLLMSPEDYLTYLKSKRTK